LTENRLVEDLLRDLAPQVLGVLLRRHGDLDSTEDAVQEALLEASQSWSVDGPPERPLGWLVTVAGRRLHDHWRSTAARRARELRDHGRTPEHARLASPADEAPNDQDDSLALLIMCCHPALSRPSQVALTLRAVGGLTTAEISRALLVPEATVAQRISRAKRQVQDAGATFDVPVPGELDERVTAVLSVLYLIFNEGYAASSGYELQRVDLTREAIRLTRMLHAQLPGHGEVGGLLALMLLTAARDPARVTPTGDLLPLDVQDRGLWRQDLISEGTTLLEHTLAVTPLGPYQLQAAIAAVHDTAPTAQETDWAQALALYQVLERLDPSPMVRLGTAVATAMVHGPPAGLQAMDRLAQDPVLAGHHRRHAVLAHLLERAGRLDEAADAYQQAAKRTLNLAEQRYLRAKYRRLKP
jgi:RNA polymerase sigma factor (sigma-70 family)